VADRDPVVKRAERAEQGAGGVALHQHGVHRMAREKPAELRCQARGQAPERLGAGHDFEVDRDPEAEAAQDRFDHLPVLARVDRHRHQGLGPGQRPDDRRQFDGFRPGPDDEGDAGLVHVQTGCCLEACRSANKLNDGGWWLGGPSNAFLPIPSVLPHDQSGCAPARRFAPPPRISGCTGEPHRGRGLFQLDGSSAGVRFRAVRLQS
jgi:hypothetical protein